MNTRGFIKKSLMFTAILMALALSACAVNFPQTAAEFRQVFPKSTFGKTDSFVVNRDFYSVARTFKKMANKCLRKRIKTTESGYMHYLVVVDRYTPTVVVSRNRAELHLQKLHESGVLTPGKLPKNGFYILVADATRAGKNRTKIDMYYPSIGHKTLATAIKGWATGKNIGCPDLTKQ